MIYDSLSGALYASDGSFLKTVHCPLGLRVKDLTELPDGSPDRYCHGCSKSITCIDSWTEEELRATLALDLGLCFFSTSAAQNVTVLKRIGSSSSNDQGLPVIRTARSMEAISDGFQRGFLPCIETVEGNSHRPDPNKIGQYYLIFQHLRTYEVWYCKDRTLVRPDSGSQEPDPLWRCVGEFFHDPEKAFPVAAYLIPPALPVGARVFLEDVIEEMAPDGFRYRGVYDSYVPKRVSGAAIWDGGKFRLDVGGTPASLNDVGLVGSPDLSAWRPPFLKK
jgi:hypothetical protein